MQGSLREMRRAKLWEVFLVCAFPFLYFPGLPDAARGPASISRSQPCQRRGAPRSVRYLLHRALALILPRTKTTKQRRQRAPHNVAWKKRGAGMLSLPGGEASSGLVGPGLSRANLAGISPD